MYPNMTKYLPFYYDEKGFYQNDKSFMITGAHVSYMAAFLNSSLFKFCFRDNFPELLGGTRELRKIFFDKTPVLQVSDYTNGIFREKVNAIQSNYTKEQAKEIDTLLFDLFVYKDKERTKVQGIRFCKDGYSFKGTQISRDYSFGKLNARLEGTENLLSARAKSAQQYEQGCHKNEQVPSISESSQDPWDGISSIGLFAPSNAQTYESFPEDESTKKKKRKRRRGFSF